jgi:hypothetical protein
MEKEKRVRCNASPLHPARIYQQHLPQRSIHAPQLTRSTDPAAAESAPDAFDTFIAFILSRQEAIRGSDGSKVDGESGIVRE